MVKILKKKNRVIYKPDTNEINTEITDDDSGSVTVFDDAFFDYMEDDDKPTMRTAMDTSLVFRLRESDNKKINSKDELVNDLGAKITEKGELIAIELMA